jgi:hypothetical protein
LSAGVLPGMSRRASEARLSVLCDSGCIAPGRAPTAFSSGWGVMEDMKCRKTIHLRPQTATGAAWARAAISVRLATVFGCFSPDASRPTGNPHHLAPRARSAASNAIRAVFIVIALCFLGLPARAGGQTSSYELCIDQSPARAGIIRPDSGTHRFSADSVVTISAEPQPGYQFAYWLGDVADPKSQQTTIQLNGPKMVVAVFRPADRDPVEPMGSAAGGGGDAALPSFHDLSTPGWNLAGGGGPKTTTQAMPVYVPVVLTPEPTTVVLLALGTLALRRRRAVS